MSFTHHRPVPRFDDVSVHAVASQLIHAAPERVSAIYQDYGHWPELFRGTVRATRLIRENDTTKAIEVEHATAGRVLNLMTVISPARFAWKSSSRITTRASPTGSTRTRAGRDSRCSRTSS